MLPDANVGDVETPSEAALCNCASLARLASWLCLARSSVFLFLVSLGRPIRLEALYMQSNPIFSHFSQGLVPEHLT